MYAGYSVNDLLRVLVGAKAAPGDSDYTLMYKLAGSTAAPGDTFNTLLRKWAAVALPPGEEDWEIAWKIAGTSARCGDSFRDLLARIATTPPVPPCALPYQPANLTITGQTTSSLTIHFQQADDAAHPYPGKLTVKWGTSPGVYTHSHNIAIPPATFNQIDLISGLASNTTYYIQVDAYNLTCGAPVSSAEISGTTSNGLLPGLISYWKFDAASSSTAVDSKGTNDLILNSATTGSATGIINRGLTLGIGGSYASKANGFTYGSGVSFTFSAWFFGTNFHNNYDSIMLVNQRTNSAVNSFQLVIYSDNNWYWQLVNTAGTFMGTTAALSANVTDGAWHHVVFGFDAVNKIAFSYFDGGNYQTVASAVDGIRASSVDWRLGEPVGTSYNALPGGVFDEVGYWNTVLNATQVATLYNGGAAFSFDNFN